MSLIEAHAAGVPAVATDVGGVRAVVRDGETGFVRRADDEVGLSSAVVQLLREPEVADRFGKSGSAHVAHRFSLDRLLRDLDGLYRDLLTASTRAQRA